MASNVLGPIAHAAGYALLRKGLSLMQSRRTRAFVEGAKRPRDAQLSLLRRILTENADTEFGKRPRVLASRRRRCVPPGGPLANVRRSTPPDRAAGADGSAMPHDGAAGVLPPDERDSGSAEEHTGHGVRPEADEARPADGGLRLVPRLSNPRRKSVRNQRPSHRRQDGRRHAVWLRVGAALQGPSRGSCGRSTCCPQSLPTSRTMRRATLRWWSTGSRSQGVTGIATANPSTFLRLLSVADQNADVVLRAIASGRLAGR